MPGKASAELYPHSVDNIGYKRVSCSHRSASSASALVWNFHADYRIAQGKRTFPPL